MKRSIAILLALLPLFVSAQQIITGKEFRYSPKDSAKYRPPQSDSGYLAVDPGTGKFYRTTAPGAAPVKVDSVTFSSSPTVDTVKYWINGVSYTSGVIDVKNGLISGGVVSWRSGLTFDISPAVYRIANKRYTSPQSSITLDAADPSNPRIDVIGLNSSGIIKIMGTAAASPAKPQPAVTTELELTNVYINTGATSPGNVRQTIIYDENTGTPGEWVATSGPFTGTINFNSTSNPQNGTKNILISTGGGGLVKFTAGSPVTITNSSLLKIWVRIDAGENDPYFEIGGVFLSLNGLNATQSLSFSDYGLNTSLRNTWQAVAIPLSDFPDITSFNEVNFKLTTAVADIHFDYVQLQGGITTPGGVPYLTDVYKKDGTDSVFKVRNGISQFAFLDQGTGGGGEWGTIVGSISAQTDLQDSLNGKVDTARAARIDTTGRQNLDVLAYDAANNKYIHVTQGTNKYYSRVQVDVDAALAAGDSVLQNDTWIGKDVDLITKDGLVLDSSGTDGYQFNKLSGVLTLHPATSTLEKYYIRMVDGGHYTYVPLSGYTPPPANLTFNSDRFHFTNSGSVFFQAADGSQNDASFNHYGLDALHLPAGVSGRIWLQFVTGENEIMLGFNTANSLDDFSQIEAAIYINSASTIRRIESGSATGSHGTAVNNIFYGLSRDGVTGAITLQSSTDENDWSGATNIQTFTFSSTADLYIQGFVKGAAGSKITNPKGTGLQ